MTKKDIFILLSPNIWMVYITIVAFLGPNTFQRHFENASQFQETQNNFERFATNVQSGKMQLTQGKMLEVMRSANTYAASQYNVAASLLGVLWHYAWALVIAIAWQVGAVLIVRRRLRKKLTANTALEPTPTAS